VGIITERLVGGSSAPTQIDGSLPFDDPSGCIGDPEITGHLQGTSRKYFKKGIAIVHMKPVIQ
jgi:hypothetical protein